MENYSTNLTSQKQEKLVVYGRNAVLEVLAANRSVNAVYVAKGGKGLYEHIVLAKKCGAVVKEVTVEKLNSLSEGNRHGGIAAELSAAAYSTLEEILSESAGSGKPPFLLITDEIEDPHNLGALIRTAEAAGVTGVIIPKRRNAQITGAVYAASAGAAAHMKIARVGNLSDTIQRLKSQNIWIYGAESDGTPYTEVDFGGSGGVAGAYCINRLVCQYDTVQIFYAAQRRFYLVGGTETQYYVQIVGICHTYFFVNNFVGFIESDAAFAVPQNYQFRSRVRHHSCRNFARECARIFGVNVLYSHPESRVFYDGQGRKRRAKNDRVGVICRDFWEQSHVFFDLRVCPVHFEVCYKKFLLHMRL